MLMLIGLSNRSLDKGYEASVHFLNRRLFDFCGSRAQALLFNRLRPKGLREVSIPEICAESENLQTAGGG